MMAGLSVYCFSCNSRTDPKCGDPFDHARKPNVDCSGKYFRMLIDKAIDNFTEVQDAFKSYPAEAHSEATCQKLVIKGKFHFYHIQNAISPGVYSAS
jgi:hypothetical protein